MNVIPFTLHNYSTALFLTHGHAKRQQLLSQQQQLIACCEMDGDAWWLWCCCCSSQDLPIIVRLCAFCAAIPGVVFCISLSDYQQSFILPVACRSQLTSSCINSYHLFLTSRLLTGRLFFSVAFHHLMNSNEALNYHHPASQKGRDNSCFVEHW